IVAHIGASQRFMPGMGLQRKGNVRHCQGTGLAAWVAAGSDGETRMSGTSVFFINAAGKFESVTSGVKPSRLRRTRARKGAEVLKHAAHFHARQCWCAALRQASVESPDEIVHIASADVEGRGNADYVSTQPAASDQNTPLPGHFHDLK